jgi:hypothetical protein
MKRQSTAALSVLAVVATTASMGWRLATHPESSTGLEQIRLVPRSEHSAPGASKALAGIRIRLSPSDFDGEVRASAHDVPRVRLAAD